MGQDQDRDVAPSVDLPPALARELVFDSAGLIPAIALDGAKGEVLMMAWINAEALAVTLKEGYVCYWSRSRQRLWRKGETSGQRQKLLRLRLDCDGDCLVFEVEQEGVACHTGRRSCFFRTFDEKSGALLETHPRLVDPKDLYGKGR